VKFYVCALVGMLIKLLYEMHGETIKIVNAEQAKLNNNYKNIVEQCSSLKVILGSKHVGGILSVLM